MSPLPFTAHERQELRYRKSAPEALLHQMLLICLVVNRLLGEVIGINQVLIANDQCLIRYHRVGPDRPLFAW